VQQGDLDLRTLRRLGPALLRRGALQDGELLRVDRNLPLMRRPMSKVTLLATLLVAAAVP
jgi:hypothetical protein